MKNLFQTRISIPATQSRRRGFTLVELMVAIVIVAVLASLAVVVARKGMERARQAKALSSLRQVTSANLAYSVENFNNINTVRSSEDPREGGEGQVVSNSFWGRLQPYLFSSVSTTDQSNLRTQIDMALDQIFNTPDTSTMKGTALDGSPIFHDGSGLPVPLAFNERVYRSPESTTPPKDAKTTDFRDSANVIYATYGYFLFNEEDGRQYVERPKGQGSPNNNIYYLDDASAIIAFLDGSVKSLRPPLEPRRFGRYVKDVRGAD